MKKVSIQGIKGCFHEEAAKMYFGEPIDAVEHDTFDELVNSVERGEANFGIIAIENTLSGSIHSNFNLIKESSLTIVGEIYHRIVQNLAVNKGVRIDDLTHVESHYMAINQCRPYFKKYSHIRLIDSIDTAASMRHVAAKKLKHTGAIGSDLAAQYYNLEIIAKSIETNKKNYTRFLILENREAQTENINKSSIQIVITNHLGGLADVLQIIKNHHINLSKIESLPIIGEPWHYQFYLDILYDNIQEFHKMLERIKPELESIAILGNYQKFNQASNL